MPETRTPSLLNPATFVSESLCNLTFEDALDKGMKRSMELEDRDWRDTSIRFCVPGLYNWIKVYSKLLGRSVYSILRDSCWMWASFCESDDTLSGLVRDYFILLKDIAENTDYVDLADRMNESFKVRNIGFTGKPINLKLPIEPHGVISDCATALGVSFSVFYQYGVGWCLTRNGRGLYEKWGRSVIDVLAEELRIRARGKLISFQAIRNEIQLRDSL